MANTILLRNLFRANINRDKFGAILQLRGAKGRGRWVGATEQVVVQ
jgi:hypothetical protein